MFNHTPEQLEAGNQVKTAQDGLNKAEGALTDNKNMLTSYRNKKSGYQQELEILESKDDDTLPYDLKLRKLDLQKDIDELDGFIGFKTKQQTSLNHSIEMASLNLDKKKGAYQDVVRVDSTTLTSADIEELKHKKLVTMPMAEKKKWISKLGSYKELQKYCPMI